MIRAAVIAVALGMPTAVMAENDAGVSEAGTAFMRACLADITESRIAMLKKRAPEFAASLSEEELNEGAQQKAMRVCPCFLHFIGVLPSGDGDTPEEKVATIVTYLDAVREGETMPVPPVLGTIAKRCSVRSSVLPPRWFGQ